MRHVLTEDQRQQIINEIAPLIAGAVPIVGRILGAAALNAGIKHIGNKLGQASANRHLRRNKVNIGPGTKYASAAPNPFA